MGAEQMGRHCLTIELDPKFADVIRRRWYRFANGLLKDDDDTGWEEATKAINR
jgi:DNA modification methylase